jgi:hypothetical protein
VGFGALNLIPVFAFFGVIVAGCKVFARGSRNLRVIAISQGWLFVTICMFSTVAFTLYDHQGYADLLFPLPFVIVFSSFFLTMVVDRAPKFGRWIIVLLFAYLALLSVHGMRRWPSLPFTVQDQIRNGATLRRILDEGESVFASGCVHLLAFAHSENWVRYGVPSPQLDRYLADKHHVDVWVPEKDGARPSIVLVSRGGPQGIEIWLERNYVQVRAPEFERERVRVFRMRGDDSSEALLRPGS